ncbi:putative Ribonuclease 3 [Nannochloris sp. 'desiccata']|nr:hypothetical protein KSW81_007897 [Chlorella desiccata (nom. nud.)]KAH7619150.1 putative Ribonuclease 3 [Chlorella desiccata (nom. nud.)]
MAQVLSFCGSSSQISLLQRPCFVGTHANLVGGMHGSLLLARYQINRRAGRAPRRSTTEKSSNALSNSRTSNSAILGRRNDLPQQRAPHQNNYNGGYSSDEGSSSALNSSPPSAIDGKPSSPPPPVPRSRIQVNPSAHDISWDACTVRGLEDGSLVFKFDQLDPRIEEELNIPMYLSDTDTTSSVITHGSSRNTSSSSSITSSLGPSSSITTTTNAATPTKATLANFAWSNTMKLGVKFPQQFEITLRKLEEYLIEFNGKTAPARVELKHSLFKTYEKAVRRQEKLLLNEGIVAGVEEMMLKEKEENKYRAKEVEVKKEEDYSDVSSAALEELKASIKNGVGMKSTGVASIPKEESKEKEEESASNSNKTRSSSSPPLILKAFYCKVVFKPLRFLLSSIRFIITWAVHLPLALYRLFPYGFRKFFHSAWPPKLPATRHISPAIDALFLDEPGGFNRTSLLAAGFDAQGRCAAPRTLLDVPAWKLEQLVGCGIGNVNLYRSALTHPTALPPESRALSYERLEYLGDAVMELCTRQLLMERAPDADEGVLTNQGQFLVAGSTVNKYGAWMGLDKWVLCNAYSMRDGLIGSPHILGDSFEALLAAVYVDRGLEAARKLLIRVFNQCPSVEWDKIGFMRDHKGELMKVAHQRRKPLPRYHVVDARHVMYRDDSSGTGNGTAIKKKYWNVEVEFDGEVIGSGSNFEKREAEREAAREGLVSLGELEESGEELGT